MYMDLKVGNTDWRPFSKFASFKIQYSREMMNDDELGHDGYFNYYILT